MQKFLTRDEYVYFKGIINKSDFGLADSKVLKSRTVLLANIGHTIKDIATILKLGIDDVEQYLSRYKSRWV